MSIADQTLGVGGPWRSDAWEEQGSRPQDSAEAGRGRAPGDRERSPHPDPHPDVRGAGGPGMVVRDRRDLGASAGALGSSAGVIPQVLKALRFLRFYRPSLELKK